MDLRADRILSVDSFPGESLVLDIVIREVIIVVNNIQLTNLLLKPLFKQLRRHVAELVRGDSVEFLLGVAHLNWVCQLDLCRGDIRN